MGFLKMLLGSVLLVSSLAPVALGQVPAYGQCGGKDWTGSKTCASGSCCVATNEYYSQCIPGGTCGGGSTPTTLTTIPTSAPTSSPGTGPKSAGCGKGATITSGTKSITVNGQQRQYTIRVPNNYDPNKGYRLIFGLHWRGGTMGDVALTSTSNGWNYYGLQKLASESAIFVAPQGFGNGWANSGGEDIAFIDALLSTISAGLCVNPNLVFATGFSWGGGMSYSIACSRATKFRAVAVIAGGVISGCSGGNDPIAYLGMHGIRDSVLNISGGRGMRDRFVKNNGCTSQSPPEVVQGSLTHRKTVYSGCRSGNPVWWIASDSDHSAAPADGVVWENKATTWAPAETWSFFSQFT
ncbi:hypothetical protein VTL71DRAFT_15709 [Oculimacula yallundae]|uniref:Feruloyl esterase C n=1 Tax=Oculimacula yallundae TaxID=86028 RepID=A0ABR4CHC6_9HELO